MFRTLNLAICDVGVLIGKFRGSNMGQSEAGAKRGLLAEMSEPRPSDTQCRLHQPGRHLQTSNYKGINTISSNIFSLKGSFCSVRITSRSVMLPLTRHFISISKWWRNDETRNSIRREIFYHYSKTICYFPFDKISR